MQTNGLGRWIGLAACLWAAAAFAQEAPEPVVLTVLGTNYTAKELGVEADSPPDLLLTRTFTKIQGGIMGAYSEKLNYQPSEEELKEYCRRAAPTAEDMDAIYGQDHPAFLNPDMIFEGLWQDWQREADDKYGAMQMAANDLKEWKFAQALFAQYGGRVCMGSFNIPGAVEAARSHLAAGEAAGDFTIHAADLRERYWALIRTPPPGPLMPEEEGRAALAEHPADRQKREAVKGLTEHLQGKPRRRPDPEPPGCLGEATLP
ncbi:MAG: hypothetical protein EOM72_13245 [Opitutae bacterium]|nr:hypothetical protein [Opitutae bacterium]